MTNVIELINNFKDRLDNKGDYIQVNPRVLAEQRLIIRTTCFKSTAEVNAFLEGLDCTKIEYNDIKRRYRVMANEFKKLSKKQQRELLTSANIDPKVALYERQDG
jgi:hypothetical protein